MIKKLYTTLTFFALITLAFAQQRPCSAYQVNIVASHKNPMIVCNGAVNALSNMDTKQIICMDKTTGGNACERFGALGAAGLWKIDSRQQFKSQTIKRITRQCGVDLMQGDAVALNGVIIDNLNTRIAIGAIRKMEYRRLFKPVKLANGIAIDTVYIIWTDIL